MKLQPCSSLDEWLATLPEVKGVCGRVIERSSQRKTEEDEDHDNGKAQ